MLHAAVTINDLRSPQVIILRNSLGGEVSTASESTINGASAFFGAQARLIMSVSRTTINRQPMRTTKLRTVHPGEILLEEFLEPLEISQYRLAKGISVSPRRINEIILGKRSITADTALRLGLFLDLPEFWMNLKPITTYRISPMSLVSD